LDGAAFFVPYFSGYNPTPQNGMFASMIAAANDSWFPKAMLSLATVSGLALVCSVCALVMR
jgi:hypothetical protein